MGSYSRTYNFTDGTTAYGSQLAFELDALGTSANNIVNAQIAPAAEIADTKLAQITTASKVSGSALTDLASVPSGAGVLPIANIPTKLIQVVNDIDVTSSTGTTPLPNDDTIPQNDEGDEYLSVAITPTATTNKLLIVALVHGGASSGSYEAAALFQDSTADALASGINEHDGNSDTRPILIIHYMDAGTEEETTFKVRAGGSAGTFTFNGKGGSRDHGGVLASSLTIMEIQV